MLGTERILVNGQRALVERLGLGIAPHLPATLSLTMALGLELIRSRPHYREHYLSPSKCTHEVRSQRPHLFRIRFLFFQNGMDVFNRFWTSDAPLDVRLWLRVLKKSFEGLGQS